MTKFLKTIRFDASDERVFEKAASPGEWAISGAFEFFDLPAELLVGRIKQAFANGFLGVPSFGHSTFATVGEASAAAIDEVELALADLFMRVYGAPSIEIARPVARQEIDYVVNLVAEAPINTLFTVRRVREESGQIREEFRTIAAPLTEPAHARIWTTEADGP